MPSVHLAVQPDGQGQGTQAPMLRMKVSRSPSKKMPSPDWCKGLGQGKSLDLS